MGHRVIINGRGQAFEGDLTTTGAKCVSSLSRSDYMQHGRAVIRKGDKTTACPQCGQTGIVQEGDWLCTIMGIATAFDGARIRCGCPPGTNRVIARPGTLPEDAKSSAGKAKEIQAASIAAALAAAQLLKKRDDEKRERNRVFAKSCLRGEGCNDAGTAPEPHTNFFPMAFFQADAPADPVTNNDVLQRAQSAKKKTPAEEIPKPRQRSAMYKWMFGDAEEQDYQMASAAAASAARIQTASEGASILRPVAGTLRIGGTWAARAGTVAIAGPGAAVAGLLVGMMPGRLNDGEQDFIDRMRARQMREAPTRVRYTWETNEHGDTVPRGWHTPPGNDIVRVRPMQWDGSRQAYTFTTEEA